MGTEQKDFRYYCDPEGRVSLLSTNTSSMPEEISTIFKKRGQGREWQDITDSTLRIAAKQPPTSTEQFAQAVLRSGSALDSLFPPRSIVTDRKDKVLNAELLAQFSRHQISSLEGYESIAMSSLPEDDALEVSMKGRIQQLFHSSKRQLLMAESTCLGITGDKEGSRRVTEKLRETIQGGVAAAIRSSKVKDLGKYGQSLEDSLNIVLSTLPRSLEGSNNPKLGSIAMPERYLQASYTVELSKGANRLIPELAWTYTSGLALAEFRRIREIEEEWAVSTMVAAAKEVRLQDDRFIDKVRQGLIEARDGTNGDKLKSLTSQVMMGLASSSNESTARHAASKAYKAKVWKNYHDRAVREVSLIKPITEGLAEYNGYKLTEEDSKWLSALQSHYNLHHMKPAKLAQRFLSGDAAGDITMTDTDIDKEIESCLNIRRSLRHTHHYNTFNEWLQAKIDERPSRVTEDVAYQPELRGDSQQSKMAPKKKALSQPRGVRGAVTSTGSRAKDSSESTKTAFRATTKDLNTAPIFGGERLDQGDQRVPFTAIERRSRRSDRGGGSQSTILDDPLRLRRGRTIQEWRDLLVSHDVWGKAADRERSFQPRERLSRFGAGGSSAGHDFSGTNRPDAAPVEVQINDQELLQATRDWIARTTRSANDDFKSGVTSI